MTFTDDDLKRLKEAAHVFDHEGVKLSALIARLEAAEAIVPFAISEHSGCGKKDCRMFGDIAAWRKAAGKS